MSELNHLIWLVALLLQFALAVRFLRLGLHLRYRAFFFWICLQAMANSALELQQPQSREYFYTWLYTEPLIVIAFMLAVFEVYSIALEHYAGIRTISARMLTFAMVVGSLISVLSIIPDLQFRGPTHSEMFDLINLIRRGIYTALLTFLVLLVSLITIFPIRLSRNSIVHIALFTVVFLNYAATILAGNLLGVDTLGTVNVVRGIVSVFCFLGWIVLLTPAGETVHRSVRSDLSRTEVELLLSKLRGVNDAVELSRRRL